MNSNYIYFRQILYKNCWYQNSVILRQWLYRQILKRQQTKILKINYRANINIEHPKYKFLKKIKNWQDKSLIENQTFLSVLPEGWKILCYNCGSTYNVPIHFIQTYSTLHYLVSRYKMHIILNDTSISLKPLFMLNEQIHNIK